MASATRRSTSETARDGPVDQVEEFLRRLALNDERVVRSALSPDAASDAGVGLDPKTRALVGLGSFVSVGAGTASYRWAVELAYAVGATDEEIAGVLSAVGPAAGVARIVAAAPDLALAIGYDIETRLT
jgi:alkylhydroperoxidase/carboxymuconolactone decarboxylase family protein YurZ